MGFVYDHASEIGVALLVVIALAKLLALSGALAFGFIGGPIFPLLFVGTALGSALVLVFPQLPVGLAVGCLTVAVPAAVVPIPLAVAALIAFSIVSGIGLAGDKKEAQAE